MAQTVAATPTPPFGSSLAVGEAATLDADAALARLGSGRRGLSSSEAASRAGSVGPNALRVHRARPMAVLIRQFRSALLILLLVTATVSFFVGDRTDAIIIGAILSISVLLGFFNEYRAELAAESLHEQLRNRAVACRDGAWTSLDVTELVPGDLVKLEMGGIVPADVRILDAAGLECDESILTGESMPVEKSVAPVASAASLGDLGDCAFMGTIVHAGSAEALVVSTGMRTEFGKIALGLGEREEQTEFQLGLRRFSLLLAEIAIILCSSIFVINVLLSRPLIDAMLFSLAIAVGITPQLLPAVVTTCLATGSRRLASQKVLVKRLVCIEDLGDIDLLLTDKTGTLTEGRITYQDAIDPSGSSSERVLLLGLVCNVSSGDAEGVSTTNPLDAATWDAPGAHDAPVSDYTLVTLVPFDHDRRRMSVLVDGPAGRMLITKGAPEGILDKCDHVPADAAATLKGALEAGSRIVCIASRPAAGLGAATVQDEEHLDLEGFLVFEDRPKATAADGLRALAALDVTVKVVTGDHPIVAEKVCRDLGLDVRGTLTGIELDALDDKALLARLPETTIFSRVTPEQKSRIIRAHRTAGTDVAFLGDGVNDAIALHHADVGISVDTGTDVAKDAADIILLEKDLGVLARGVVEGRRTFANTIKYVQMGTSSNFGNMFSAAAASAFLKFLPMLPSQILLNNLLYDASQMTIPTDRVDPEQLARPSHWDISYIRRFMLLFGPISSIFDFITFAIMLHVFHAGPVLFRTGWFVESLATQTLIIFVIRTRRIPFFKSRPSSPLLTATVAVVAIGAIVPVTPLASTLGFRALPLAFYGALAAMIVAYLLLTELAKVEFYRNPDRPHRKLRSHATRRIHRRAARFSHHGPLTP